MKLTIVAALLAVLTSACACSSTRPDPNVLADSVVNRSKTEQTQLRLTPGVAVAEDGNATASPTEVGLDIQNGVTAAANPVTIQSLVGSEKAAAALLSQETPQERAINTQVGRVQANLEIIEAQIVALDPNDARRTTLAARRDSLEATEAALTNKLGEIYTQKLEGAKALLPSLESLERVYYLVFAPQTNQTGRAMSDAQSAAAAGAYAEVLKALTKDAADGGGE